MKQIKINIYNSKIYIVSFLLITTFSACNKKVLSSNTSKLSNIDNVLENIISNIATLSKNGRPLRLAVIPFYSSLEKTTSENKFGEYFTEQSITKIKNIKSNIKLYERKHLDLLSKEHALNLSGLINESEVIKIGELAPIDFLLTGTYTKLESSIEINGRILDVVTGEIIHTFSHQIDLTSNISYLFTTNKPITSNDNTSNTVKNSNKPACYSDFVKLKNVIKTESDKEIRFKKMTDIALTIPVNIECGKYHHFYINYLSKQKHLSKRYKEYLYNETLNYSESPDIGPLISSILKYFHNDNDIDSKEWELGLSILRKSSDITSSYFVKYLFTKPTKANMNIQKERIDQLVKLIKSNKILLGQHSSPSKGIYHIFTELENGNNISNLQIYLLKNHFTMIQDKQYSIQFYKKIVTLFKNEKELKKRQILLNWMSDLAKYDKEHGSSAFALFHILEKLSKNAEKSLQDSIILELFKIKMKPSMNRLFTCCLNIPKCQKLCIENNIHIEGLTPTLSELKLKLTSDDSKVKLNASMLIEAYGIRAKPIEKDIARALRQLTNLTSSYDVRIEKNLLKSLGSIKTTNTEIIQNIFLRFSSTQHSITKTAMDVIETLGEPSFKILTANFDNSKAFVQIRIIKTLAKMDSLKKDVITFIKNKRKSTTFDSVKNASEDALIRMGAL